jgi:hypothetical protein
MEPPDTLNPAITWPAFHRTQPLCIWTAKVLAVYQSRIPIASCFLGHLGRVVWVTV